MFRVNPKTVTRWARAGKLTAIRTLGGHRRFKASEIRALPRGDVAVRGVTPAGCARLRAHAVVSGLMATPTAAFSLHLRVRLDNAPGSLGRLATAIGEAGGNITQLDGFDVRGEYLDEDIVVNCTSEAHQEEVKAAISGLDGIEITRSATAPSRCTRAARSRSWPGCPIGDRDDLSMAYTPGVARVCMAIAADQRAQPRPHDQARTPSPSSPTAPPCSASATSARTPPCRSWRARRCCSRSSPASTPSRSASTPRTADEIIETVERLAPAFGGINLEDIAAPECFEVEERLKATLDIPVFHDDQHGTAVVVLAALQNALKLIGKKMGDLRVVIAGVGAAGRGHRQDPHRGRRARDHRRRPQGRHLGGPGRPEPGQAVVRREHQPRPPQGRASASCSPAPTCSSASPAPGIIEPTDLDRMDTDPIVFALANPDPEIRPEQAEGRAASSPPAAATSRTRSTTCWPSPASSGAPSTPRPPTSPRA